MLFRSDQGSSLIGGYTNDLAAQMAVKLPVVVFGDHTRAIKYIDIPFAAGADGIKVLEPSEIYDPKAFYWFVSAIRLPEKGYARHFQYLRASDMPLPPLNEQRRIAAKLDTTLASVDSCRQRLEGVATLIKRFRQAVLEAATTGELTREWREEHGHKYDWQQRRLADVAEARLGKMLDQAKNFGEPTPYLRNVNVRWFAFDLSDIQLMRLAPEERSELDVCNGDLLVCEGGEPGRCAVWRDPDSNITFQKALQIGRAHV